MGRGGTTSLWSSGLTGCPHARWGVRANSRNRISLGRREACNSRVLPLDCIKLGITPSTRRQSYRVKPHEQLVPVSSTHYCASTPGLSTSWSRTTLQGARGPGKTHLETSFPLRCFQRLSLPHIATRRCHWRDNRYTRGASTPVLSY